MPAGYRLIPTDPPGIIIPRRRAKYSLMAPQNTEESCDRSPRHGYPTEDTFEDRGAGAVTDVEQDAHAGVKKVQAALRINGRYSRWWLFIGYAHSPTVVETHCQRLLLCPSPSLVSTASSDFSPSHAV